MVGQANRQTAAARDLALLGPQPHRRLDHLEAAHEQVVDRAGVSGGKSRPWKRFQLRTPSTMLA
jgi:hypothetical protein